MNKTILVTAGILAGLSVILGAMGAHALKVLIGPDALESFQTGVQYQMYHALFLLFLGNFLKIKEQYRKQIFLLMVTGVCCFSGSIYLLSTAAITGINFKPFAFITPVGGMLLIGGWILFVVRMLYLRMSNP